MKPLQGCVICSVKQRHNRPTTVWKQPFVSLLCSKCLNDAPLTYILSAHKHLSQQLLRKQFLTLSQWRRWEETFHHVNTKRTTTQINSFLSDVCRQYITLTVKVLFLHFLKLGFTADSNFRLEQMIKLWCTHCRLQFCQPSGWPTVSWPDTSCDLTDFVGFLLTPCWTRLEPMYHFLNLYIF